MLLNGQIIYTQRNDTRANWEGNGIMIIGALRV